MATRALLYRRVSTDEQGESGLGLAAQLERLRDEAERRGWDSEEVQADVTSGATPAEDREHLGPALDSLRPGDVLAVTRLDRLSRSTLDFARLLERATRDGWSVVVLDLGIDMTTPNGELIASILMAVAQWERKMIGQRVREGLAQSDKTLGRVQPSGKWSRTAAVPDTVLAAVEDLQAAGLPPGRIAERLNAHGHQSPRGKRWHRESVRRLLTRVDTADDRVVQSR